MIKSAALRYLVEQSGVKTMDVIDFGHIPFNEDQLVKYTMLVIECQRNLDNREHEQSKIPVSVPNSLG